MIDDTKAAPILADNIATMLARYPGDDMILTAESASEVLAALRTVEAVRAFPIEPPREPDESCKTDPCEYCDGYRDGVEAVQEIAQTDERKAETK